MLSRYRNNLKLVHCLHNLNVFGWDTLDRRWCYEFIKLHGMWDRDLTFLHYYSCYCFCVIFSVCCWASAGMYQEIRITSSDCLYCP
jgi:hypothetical protein